MSQALLITQCLQNDFVRPIGPHEPLPNLLHIGHLESRRLMGENPAEGPVARILEWAYQQPDALLKLIHIRHWHQTEDPSQLNHLMHFGYHCEAGSDGADFAFNIPEGHAKTVGIVDTVTLNDFLNTHLSAELAPYQGQKCRVGLMGVWTEAKITYLAYELSSRYPDFEIGVCSALTASADRSRHFTALTHLQTFFNIKVFDALASFMRFLGGEPEDLPLTGWKKSSKPLLVLDSLPALNETDSQLVRYLFKDARVVRLQRLNTSYGNEVLGTRSSDLYGKQQVSHIIKMGWNHLIGQERMAFEAIEPLLGSNAPRIVDFIESGERAALKYRYASMSNNFSTSLFSLYGSLSLEALENLLYTVFVEQLGRLYAGARYEKIDLLAYYAYSTQQAPEVRRQVEKIIGQPAEGDALILANGTSMPNLCHFYEHCLPLLQTQHTGGGCYVSYVHGDLNAANILRDEHQNVWLIDFYHSHRGHVLRDLIKLENDLLYLMTPIEDDAALAEAFELTRFLMRVEDLRAPLPPLEESGLVNPSLRKAYATLRMLRRFYPELIHSDRNPLQLFVGQLHYAVQTLGSVSANGRQKQWALYMAALCAKEIEWRILAQKGDLWISWLPKLRTAPGRLGLTLLPGRTDRRRVLQQDLHSLKQQQVSHIVTLITEAEMEAYGVPELRSAIQAAGFESYHLPIVAQGTAASEDVLAALDWIQAALEQQGQVLLHCVEGLGRSGMLAASFLRRHGLPTHQALAEVRAVRSMRAIETQAQEDFVNRFLSAET